MLPLSQTATFVCLIVVNIYQLYTLANSAFYPQLDGKWVPAKVLWCSAVGE